MRLLIRWTPRGDEAENGAEMAALISHGPSEAIGTPLTDGLTEIARWHYCLDAEEPWRWFTGTFVLRSDGTLLSKHGDAFFRHATLRDPAPEQVESWLRARGYEIHRVTPGCQEDYR